MLYIENARVFPPPKTARNAIILIENGKIKKVFAGRKHGYLRAAKTIDAKGRIVCPGFMDIHLQGAGGCDFLDGTPEAIEKISQTLASVGTTSYLATTVFKNGSNNHISNIVKGCGLRVKDYGAECLGIHLEGPFVNKGKKGMIREDGIRGCSLSYLNKIIKLTDGKLKMMTIAPELKGAIGAIKKLRKEKIIASFGHSDASIEQAKEGIKAGITHATHIFNAMRSIHHRDPGPLPALLTDDKVSIQLIADGVHVHPEIIKLILKLKGVKNICLITDSMSSMGLRDGKYTYDGWNYESKNGACRYRDGTLIGTALPLNKMVKRMMEFTGISLPDALKMVTINPAKVLGIDNRKGSIGEGKDADLVIMDKDLNVDMTIVGGEVVYRKISV